MGDAKLTDLLTTLADCDKARSFSIYDRCKAVYEGLQMRTEERIRAVRRVIDQGEALMN